MSGSYNRHNENEKCVKMLVGKREVQTPLINPRHRRKDNIKMDFK